MRFPQRSGRSAFALFVICVVILLKTMSFGFAVAPNSGIGVLSGQPEHVRFHQVVVGQNRVLQVTLINTGSGSVTVRQITQNRPEFQIQNLQVPFTLRAGKGIRFNVVFSPADTERLSDQIGFIHDGANSPYYVNVHGSGVPSGALTPDPAAVHFGNVQVGNEVTDYVILKNNGTSTVTISRAQPDGAGFSVTGLNVPTQLTAGQSLTFGAVFKPQVEGASYGHISINSDAPNPSFRIGLSGTGTQAGSLAVSPAHLDFGNVSVGLSKVLNGRLLATNAAVTVTSAVVSSSEFELENISFPVTIPAGGNLTFSVKFQPADWGRVSAKLSFVSDAANSPTSESLTGFGVGAANHSVSLNWKPSKSPDVVGYNIYRKIQHQGSYEKLNPGLDPVTNYLDASVQGGVIYCYVTTAVDASGNESQHSKKVIATIPYP